MIVLEAGAVVYRINNGRIEFLILKSRKNPANWIFPKGHIEAGETAEIAATRELCEEGGVIGICKDLLGTMQFEFKGDSIRVDYYLHEFKDTLNNGEPGRDPEWCDFQSASEKLSFKESVQLLERAVEILEK